MSFNSRLAIILLRILYVVVILGFAGACTKPQEYKTQADDEVYKIIDHKWQSRFGQKTNYKISDIPPSTNDIKVDTNVPTPDVISLAQAVATATANNREYQTQKEDLYMMALNLTLVRHGFEQKWFATVDAGYQHDSADESLNSNADMGFTQMLADGAVISTDIAVDWMQFLTGSPRTSLGSVLSATISQPLLRGAGREIAQENLTQVERDVLYKIREFNHFRKTFVVSIVTDYYRILQQMDEVNNARNNYQRRVESQQRLEMEADAGRRNRFEVDQAKTDVLRAKDNYVRAQQFYEQGLDDFKLRLALPMDVNVALDSNELKALQNIVIDEPNYTVEAAVDSAMFWRLDLATDKDRIEDAMRKVKVAENNLGAGLNLVASLNVPSKGPTDVANLQFQNGTYNVGLEADLPLDRKSERNEYRKTLITLERQKRQYDNKKDDVKLQVRQVYRQLQEAAERYRIQKTSLELAHSRVESTTLLLEAGRSTTRDLLESQDALLEAQNALTAALVDHAIAKLSFFRDIGILQVRPDGMWVK
jgi:outer membrane protein TolC